MLCKRGAIAIISPPGQPRPPAQGEGARTQRPTIALEWKEEEIWPVWRVLFSSGVRDAWNLKEGESGHEREREDWEGGRYIRLMESECNKGVGCTLVGWWWLNVCLHSSEPQRLHLQLNNTRLIRHTCLISQVNERGYCRVVRSHNWKHARVCDSVHTLGV